MRIIDAHVHVLDRYPSMTPFEDLGRVDRLLHLMDGAGVEKAVMLPVVADFAPDNNQQCARWSKEHPDRLLTMTDVSLDQPEAPIQVREARERYGAVAISCYPARGLAWMTAAETEPLWQAFADTGLKCNLHVTPEDYPHAIAVARSHPDIILLLNHFGLPKAGKVRADSVSYGGLGDARDLGNLYVKISAFYSVAEDEAWNPHCTGALDYLHSLKELFGVERLLFGTDWPPAGNHLTYRQCVEIGRSIADGLDDAERARLLAGTAEAVFAT
ncbi:MAG: amidohydrolase family protein [Candidatus Latescibacterota bacterium]|nr:amidohydrolase family protein [Candidatus Latescibacterota bacterium]